MFRSEGGCDVVAQVAGGVTGARVEFDGGVDLLHQVLVAYAEHGSLAHLRMLQQGRLDGGRVELEPAVLDDVTDPAVQPEIAVAVPVA